MSGYLDDYLKKKDKIDNKRWKLNKRLSIAAVILAGVSAIMAILSVVITLMR